MVIEPSEATYNGLMTYVSSLAGPPQSDSKLIENYFNGVWKKKVQLLDHLDVAYGQCLGKIPQPKFVYQESGKPVPGFWGVPAFVHRSSVNN